MKLKTIEEITEAREVKNMLSYLEGLAKPKYDLAKYMNRIADVYKKDTDLLEMYLAIFSAWQNYLGEQLVISDAVKTVAESQKKYFYSKAISKTIGKNITEKREMAYENKLYQEATLVVIEADSIYRALQTKFDNCERAYRLVSRIIAKRINIRQLD